LPTLTSRSWLRVWSPAQSAAGARDAPRHRTWTAALPHPTRWFPCHLGCDVAVVAADKRDVVVPELVIEAARAGEVVDCGDADDRGMVAADLLRTLCQERPDEVDDRGLHLRNALVTGDLDLSAATVPFPLTFEGCRLPRARHGHGS
jgi:hypothetical protein